MSVGPVGPGGGIYPIIYDVVCKVNFQKLIWRPNNRGYMQLCLCLWALSLFFKYTLYTTYPIIEYITPPGKQLWIYAVLIMSVGPVGPGGGIYSSTEDVLCRVNFRKMIWRPNNRGYMQFCFCLWALSGPEVGYIQVQKMFCAESIFEK